MFAGGGHGQIPGRAALCTSPRPGVGAQLAIKKTHGRRAHNPGDQRRRAEEETSHRAP